MTFQRDWRAVSRSQPDGEGEKVFRAGTTCGCLEGRRDSKAFMGRRGLCDPEIERRRSQQIPAESGRVALRIVILENGLLGLT